MRILITGASGHLGGEIARQMAGPAVDLDLWGRDAARLEAVAAQCRERGAGVAVKQLDFDNLESALSALTEADSAAPFDMVLLVAGQGATREPAETVEDAAQVARQCHINFTAPSAMAAQIAARMCARGAGRIGIVGSAAAFHSLPFAPSYAGSKAGLARFADALRIAASPHGVTITLVAPGFITPPPGGGERPARPFESPVETIAARIITATSQGRAELVTPRAFGALRRLDTMLPRVLRDRLLSALPTP